MKKIIKTVKHYVCTCENCGTIFSYEREDLIHRVEEIVECPICREESRHWKSEVVYYGTGEEINYD